MKFGLSQIWKQSPLFISRIKRAFNFFTMGVIAFTGKICEWGDWTPEGFATCVGLIGLGINVIGIMFGVDPEKEPQQEPSQP